MSQFALLPSPHEHNRTTNEAEVASSPQPLVELGCPIAFLITVARTWYTAQSVVMPRETFGQLRTDKDEAWTQHRPTAVSPFPPIGHASATAARIGLYDNGRDCCRSWTHGAGDFVRLRSVGRMIAGVLSDTPALVPPCPVPTANLRSHYSETRSRPPDSLVAVARCNTVNVHSWQHNWPSVGRTTPGVVDKA